MIVVTERDGIRHRANRSEADKRVGVTDCGIRVAHVDRPCDPSSQHQRRTRGDCGAIVNCGACFGGR